jgi:hypothetical protein
VVSHLEYAMNMTSQPYPLPWGVFDRCLTPFPFGSAQL